MKKRLPAFTAALLLLGSYLAAPACAQYVPVIPVIGLVQMIAAQKKANDALVARTTTTTTYRGQSFLMKRCPEDVLAGDAADRITQLENQLESSYKALLADSTSRTCSPEQQKAIRENLNYIGLARPGWSMQAYRQEFKFYLAEDKRRQHALASAPAK